MVGITPCYRITLENGSYGVETYINADSKIQITFEDGNTLIVRPRGRLKKYDVPVYRTPGGKYIMHRIVRVRPEDYVIIGDNRLQKEYVTDDSICGVLAGFYKDGKRYVDCQNSRRYRLYSRVWVALYPVRPLIMFVHKGCGWIRRHIFKRGERS